MSRIVATLRRDVLTQARSGFYVVGGFLTLVWITLFSFIPADFRAEHAARFVAAFVPINSLITTFFFVGALVLLERNEGTLLGILVTPLRPAEYLLAKVVTLSVLASVETLLVLLFAFGAGGNLPLLVTSTLLVGVVYTLLGFVAVTPFDTITDYLLPMTGYVVLMLLPVLSLWWNHPLFYAHPLTPLVTALRATYNPTAGLLVYGVGGTLILAIVAFTWANRAFATFALRLT